MTLVHHLHFAAILFIGLLLLHFVIPRRFNWAEELPRLGLFNRQMLVVHTIFIALTCGLMALLLLTSSDLLISTELGRRVFMGFAVFWTLRLAIQLFGYSSELWRGQGFETFVHFAFTLLWIYLSGLFIYAAWWA